MSKLVSLSIRWPRAVVGVWAVFIAAAAVFALQLDGALSSGGFTNPRAEALVAQSTIEDKFGDAPNQFVVVLDSDEPLSTAAIDSVESFLRDAGAVEVSVPTNGSPHMSSDEQTAILIAGFAGENSSAQTLTPKLQDGLSDLDGLRVYVTGQPALDFALNEHSKDDALRAEMIVFPLLLIILLIVFRSVVAAVIPLVFAGAALALAMATGFWITHVTELSNLYSNIVSMIGLAVAVDYSLFIVKRFQEELPGSPDPASAVRKAMRTAGHSVLFSGLAVIVALASLLLPQVMAFTSIALGGILVTLFALLLSHTLLPAVLSLLGSRINLLPLPAKWFSKDGRAHASRPVSRAVVWAGVAALVGMVLLAIPATGISLQSPVASATILPANDPARVGLDIVSDKLDANDIFPIQILLSGTDADDLDWAIRAVSDAAATHRAVGSVTSLSQLGIDGAASASTSSTVGNAAVEQLWVAADGRYYSRIIVTPTTSPDSLESHELVQALRSPQLVDLPESVSMKVTGATAQGLDFDETLVSSIPLIAVLIFVVTFGLLVAAFRSLILPAIALAFNALVVGASLGALALIQEATSGEPLNSVTPILLFAVMFGLSMDYMVIIMARIIEAFEKSGDYANAVTAGIRATRSMINSAAIIMIAVFLSFMTGQISIVREIGIGLAIAVALDAVLVRMLVMPAVLSLIGPRALGRSTNRRAAEHQTKGETIATI